MTQSDQHFKGWAEKREREKKSCCYNQNIFSGEFFYCVVMAECLVERRKKIHTQKKFMYESKRSIIVLFHLLNFLTALFSSSLHVDFVLKIMDDFRVHNKGKKNLKIITLYVYMLLEQFLRCGR